MSGSPTGEPGATRHPPGAALEIEVSFLPAAVTLEWHGPAAVFERVRSEVQAAVRGEFEARFNEYKQAKLAELEQLRGAVRGFSAAVRELRAEAGRVLEQSLQHALQLAVRLGEKLVCEAYRDDPKLLAAVARRVAQQLAEQTDAPILVRLHPETLATLESGAGAEALAELVDAGIALAADAQVPKGAVMAEAAEVAGWWYPEQELAWLAEALWAQLRHDDNRTKGQADAAP